MPDSTNTPFITPLHWDNDALVLLDQRLLPGEETYVRCADYRGVVEAIRTMVVRGAPAIGIAGAYGVVLAAREAFAATPGQWLTRIAPALAALREARPTAVNLAWAVDRMASEFEHLSGDPIAALLAMAHKIHSDDLVANQRMGELGAAFIQPGAKVMTHCNAGALATAGYGTALGVIRSAHRAGRLIQVFATETRPWLQGARLTAWELHRDGIPVRLITDGSAAHVMRAEQVAWVIVGADRVAANGDVANKIGTFGLALAARALGARFMVVAPRSTIDLNTATGAAIPIEERPGDEVLHVSGQRFAAPGVAALNPVFDVTPAALIDVLVTEVGALELPSTEGLARLLAQA
jgi:methylthioribose-1-phosphate isomerase